MYGLESDSFAQQAVSTIGDHCYCSTAPAVLQNCSNNLEQQLANPRGVE